MTRRQTLVALAAAAQARAAADDAALVARNDANVERLLKLQVTDPRSPWLGGAPDASGLYEPGSGSAILESCSAAFIHPPSRFHRDPELANRMRLAARFLDRQQSPEGNVSLLVTNFNSPPDTGFVVHHVATAAVIARRAGFDEIARIPRAFLLKAGGGLAEGGIHTPNHRWVVSSALAQIHELYPDPRYTRRIAQWLAEGIDIDADGQYTERSMLTYNIVVDRALIVLASKLKRPELLEPVRRNLHSMLYFLHPDGEVVSEISRRQDRNTRGDIGRYWFPLQYMALADRDGQFAGLAARYREKYADLATMLEYPELGKPLPAAKPLPEDFEKTFPELGVARIRRASTSATLIFSGNSRFFSLRRGDAAIHAIRFASAFFGKGQFIPERFEKRGASYVFSQSLEAAYYQPVDRKVTSAQWNEARAQRRRTQICRLEQSAAVTETPAGFRVRLQSSGTPGVPVAVEIALRAGGTLEGCAKSPQAPDTWILSQGQASYSAGGSRIRFGPGAAEHQYTQVRGAEEKLEGPSVYLTGYTPYDRTLQFEWD